MTPEEIKASFAKAAAKEQRRQLREQERQRERDEERQRQDQERQRERDNERRRRAEEVQGEKEEERHRLPMPSNGQQQPQPLFAHPQLNVDPRRQQCHSQNQRPIRDPVGQPQRRVEPAEPEAGRRQIPRDDQRHAQPPPQRTSIPSSDAPARPKADAVPTVTGADLTDLATPAPALTPEDIAAGGILPAGAEKAWPVVVEALKPSAKFAGFVARSIWCLVKDILWNILKPIRWLLIQLISSMIVLLVVFAVIGYVFVSVGGLVGQTAEASMQFLPAWARNVLGQQVNGTGTTAVAAVTAVTTAAREVPTVMALFSKAPDVGRGVEYLSGAAVGVVGGIDAWRESTAAERILGGVLDSGGGAFGSPERWNEQLQLLQEDVVSTVDKDQKRGEQVALAISQEIRAATNLLAEMDDDADNIPDVSAAQSWLGKCVDAGRDLLSSGSQSDATAIAAAAAQVEKWAQRFGNIVDSASATRRDVLHAATQEVNQAADGVSQYACGLRSVFDAAIDLGDKAMEYSQRQQVKPKWWHLGYWMGSDKDGGAGRDVEAVRLKSLAAVGGGRGVGDGDGDVGYLGEGIQQLRMFQAACSNVCRDAYSTREGTGEALAGLEEEQRELRQRGDVVEAIRQRAAAIVDVVSARGRKNVVDSAASVKAGDVARLKRELRQEVVKFVDAIWARCSGEDDEDGNEV